MAKGVLGKGIESLIPGLHKHCCDTVCASFQAAYSMEPAYCKQYKKSLGFDDNPKKLFECLGGVKFDEGKQRWDLLPIEILEQVVARYTHGAIKYGPNNWQKVDGAKDRYYAALLRHLSAARQGERMDPDAPHLTHLSAVIWNAIALAWLDENEGRS